MFRCFFLAFSDSLRNISNMLIVLAVWDFPYKDTVRIVARVDLPIDVEDEFGLTFR